MCLAIEEMRNDAKSEGIAQGLEQGIAQGIEQGIQQGIAQGLEQGIEQGLEQGVEQGKFKTLAGLVQKGLLTLSQAAEEAGVTVAEFETAIASIK